MQHQRSNLALQVQPFNPAKSIWIRFVIVVVGGGVVVTVVVLLFFLVLAVVVKIYLAR